MLAVYHRVINCFDFVAVEAVYHKKCLSPETTPVTVKRLAGHPVDPVMVQAFDETCAWLETCESPTTL